MKIKLTPIALLATAATALYWRRRAVQAENRLTARVLADERERAERASAGKGFWDMFFSDKPSATKPDLSEVSKGVKDSNFKGWARTVGSDLTAEELTHGGKQLGGVVPDPPEGQKLKLARCSMSVRVPKEIADALKRDLEARNKAKGESHE